MGTLLRQKEVTANAYNYNCEFKRLTQLFGRTLEMKYFKMKHDSNQINGVNQQVNAQDQYMNEEGDMLDHGDLPQDDGAGPQDYDIPDDNAGVEHGFVEAEGNLDGFCSQI